MTEKNQQAQNPTGAGEQISTERLIERITEYLSAGGLFNPELMDHRKVSELLWDCRNALRNQRETCDTCKGFKIVNIDDWRQQPCPDCSPGLRREEGKGETWQPILTAPKDGTWILLRGRNAAGRPMIPVVAAWHPLGVGPRSYGWADSGTFKDVNELAVDWLPLPNGEMVAALRSALIEARANLRHATHCRSNQPMIPPRGFNRYPCDCGIDHAREVATAALSTAREPSLPSGERTTSAPMGIDDFWHDIEIYPPPIDRTLLVANEHGFGRLGFWNGLYWRNNDYNGSSLNLDGFTPRHWRRYIPPGMDRRRYAELMENEVLGK